MGFSIHDISRCGRDLFNIIIVFTVISIIFIALRFWSARYARRRISADDVFAVFAFVANGFLTGFAIWGIFNGLGKHITELTRPELTDQVALLLIAEFTYVLGSAFVKMSMLCLLHRIYTTPTFRRWCYVLMALDVIYVVSFIPIFLTNCIPLSQYWDPKPTGWCRNTLISDNVTIGFNLLLDFGILILPLPVLWRLQMSLRDKITVTSMFSIGLVTIGFVFWRLVETIRTRGQPDWTTSLCTVGTIAALEIYLGIIAICIPTYGPLFNAYVKPLLYRLGLAKNSMARSSMMVKHSDLETFGGSNKRSRPRNTDFSLDRTITGDDNMTLAPSRDAKVMAECAYEPNDGRKPYHAHDEIHVKSDVEAVYHCKHCQHCQTGQK
ncbi:hypothetical protein GGS21DRAFT_488324 [Xylaria nigripes]|nr:hypothetical protein GGS21DRAFT_488324 [Xylaria nigripes]